MSKIYFFLLLVLNSLFVDAQSYYPYYSSDTTVCFNLSQECSKRVQNSFIVPEDVKHDYKKDYLSYKEESFNYSRSLIRKSSINDDLLNPFVQSVYANIVKANPSVAGYQIVISDYPMMNAANIGGKVIVLYAPLLSRLHNEGEVAAVLCHEIAHGELDHLQKGLKKFLDDFYNKQFQKELKTVLKEEFNVNSKIDLLLRKFTFGKRYHDRSLEKAADSLGYILLNKTVYDSDRAISLLSVLKEIDAPVYSDKIDYAGLFKCNSSTFDFNSIKPYKTESIFNVDKEKDELEDSLKSHPDCDKRIAYIRELEKRVPPKKGSVDDSTNYSKFQWAGAMEMIQAYYRYEYYDLSLFNALLYLGKNPNDDFLKTIIELNLSGLYEAMKVHELSDYVSNYSDENPASLNDFIYLLNNVRLSELGSFAGCFYQKQVTAIKENEYSIAAGYCCSKINDDGKSDSWKEKYRSAYKEGRFKGLLELDPKPDKKKKK